MLEHIIFRGQDGRFFSNKASLFLVWISNKVVNKDDYENQHNDDVNQHDSDSLPASNNKAIDRPILENFIVANREVVGRNPESEEGRDEIKEWEAISN